jgi:hypothetical protein
VPGFNDGGGSEPTAPTLKQRVEALERDLERQRSLTSRLVERDANLQEIEERLRAIESGNAELLYDIMLWVSALSSGKDTDTMMLPRFSTASIYLSEGAGNSPVLVSEAMVNFLGSFGLSSAGIHHTRRGSWWDLFFVKVKGVATSEEGKKVIAKAARALELETLDKPKSEVTGAQAAAAIQLMEVTKGDASSVVQVDNMLHIRWTDKAGGSHTHTMSLTDEELSDYRQGKLGRWSGYLNVGSPDFLDGQSGVGFALVDELIRRGVEGDKGKLNEVLSLPSPAPSKRRTRKSPPLT